MRNFLFMKLPVILFLAFSAGTTFAQNKTVSGSIIDDRGDVLSGDPNDDIMQIIFEQFI